METRIVDEVTKGLYSQLTAADMRVAIYTRTEVGFGIVEMKRQDGVNSRQRLYMANTSVPTAATADIVASGE